jgi:hypothetical protein
MSRFTFELATPADDDQLVELLSATPMEGAVSIALTRKPSYFAAADVDGQIVQVGIARDGESGRIVGMGSRSIGMKYVNGDRVAVGYLSGLRLLPEFRGRARLLARGYQFLQQLHADGAANFYITTIAADNSTAANLLTSGRADLPVYHPCGNYFTLAMSTERALRNGTVGSNTFLVRDARLSDRDAIVAYLNKHGPMRAFFPVYDEHDLFTGDGQLKGLHCEDVLLAIRDDEIVGTFGCWNQRAFKQIVIHGYRGWLRNLRPLYNGWANLRREPTLPSAGSVLPAKLAVIPCVRDDDPEIFCRLLFAALNKMASACEPLLLLGLHETDPLLPHARKYSSREYTTKLFIVYWPDKKVDVGQVTQRPIYLELGAL